MQLQLSANSSIIVRGASLFNEKWADEEIFIRYFNAQGVEQLNGWHEGFAPGIPSTIESFNRTIKTSSMFGCRMKVDQFLELIKQKIVRGWLSDRDPADVNAKFYAHYPEYTWTIVLDVHFNNHWLK